MEERNWRIFGIIAIVFGLPLVSVYALYEFEKSERYFTSSDAAKIDNTESVTHEFIDILKKIDASLMSFFADFRETYLHSS